MRRRGVRRYRRWRRIAGLPSRIHGRTLWHLIVIRPAVFHVVTGRWWRRRLPVTRGSFVNRPAVFHMVTGWWPGARRPLVRWPAIIHVMNRRPGRGRTTLERRALRFHHIAVLAWVGREGRLVMWPMILDGGQAVLRLMMAPVIEVVNRRSQRWRSRFRTGRIGM